MKISTRGRYALRFMIDLAQQDNGIWIALKDISARQGISVKYLEQIASMLCKAGFLISVRGAQGGYRLAKRASEYTVGSILRITEGSLSPVACLDKEELCPRNEECSTIAFWRGLNTTINTYVDSITLDMLMTKDKTGCDFSI